MIDATAQSNGCENTFVAPSSSVPVGYRTSFPLHVAYTGSQLDYAVSYLKRTRGPGWSASPSVPTTCSCARRRTPTSAPGRTSAR